MNTSRNSWQRYGAVLLCASTALISLGCVHGGGSSNNDEQAEQDTDPSEQYESVDARGGSGDICEKTSEQLLKACKLEARDDAQVESAKCLNLTDPQAAEACINAAEEARDDTLEECAIVRDARNQVCTKLGGGAYDPVINPANFVAGISNPFTPFPPGAFRVYEKQTAEGLERIRVEVLPETREIMGVTVTTLRDTVTLDGVLIEDTLDWLAQDVDGNVWYFGEIVQNFENGMLSDLDGSFETGKAGAKPGFWSKAAPQVGDFFRQEWDLSNAEDVVEVISLDARDTTVPFSQNGTGPVLKTRDTTPLSPDAVEFKYYVPGIGFALEVNPDTGERLELIDYGPR